MPGTLYIHSFIVVMFTIMASRMTLFACVLVSLFDVCRAGFETLEKPFTGAQESAWESMASRNQEQQARREKSMASVSCKSGS